MTNHTVNYLRQEYEGQKSLFEKQLTIVQRFLEGQARVVADALVTKTARVRFVLPDRVLAHVAQVGQNAEVAIPEAQRQIQVGSIFQPDVREALIRKLKELDKSADQAVAVSADLLRYAAAVYMIQNMLPSGRDVLYRPDGTDEIPNIPVDDLAPESAITQASDAIAEEGSDDGRGEVQTPFVPAARKFFLPQWVAFDTDGKMLVGSVEEAEAHVQSMQRYLLILHRALSLAPYISASEEYQRKRYGMLGQLVNQGRALARFKTLEIIARIKKRAAEQSLNRGLRLTLPYFDDQTLKMENSNLDVIPAGRIMFVPAFIVRAAQGEQAKVAQDTRLNASTRKHLLTLLKALEAAFDAASSEKV